jgi:glutathione S-transferase
VKPCGRGSRHRAEVEALGLADRVTYPFLVDDTANVKLFESEDICMHLLETYGKPRGVDSLPEPADYFLQSTLVTGWVPSLFRFGRGAAIDDRVAGAQPPAQPLILYNYEGNQFCRLVREALCELDLPHEMRPTGKGSPRRSELQEKSGKTTAPYLIDPNGPVQMGESADIVEYLWTTYG